MKFVEVTLRRAAICRRNSDLCASVMRISAS